MGKRKKTEMAEIVYRDRETIVSNTLYTDGQIETVTVCELVRCRDCEHKDRESGFCHGRGWPTQLVPDDGFCDKGKGR